MAIKHAFSVTIPDGSNTALVKPSDWNSSHVGESTCPAAIVIGGNTSGTLLTITSGTVQFDGGNNITLSQQGQSITISAPNVLDPSVSVSFELTSHTSVFEQKTHTSIFEQTTHTSAFQLTANMTGYQSTGGYLTSQSTGPAAFIVGGTNTSGTLSTVTSGTIQFVGGTNITLSQQGQTITISGGAGGGVAIDVGGANTSGTLSTVTAGTVQFIGGNNVTLSQNGAFITISGGSAGGGGVALSGSNTLFTSGTIVFTGSDIITVKSGAGSLIFDATYSQSTAPAAFQLAGANTSGTLSTITSGTIQFVGGNNITLSQNNQSITISAANAGGAQTGISGISGSNTLFTSGTVVFTGSDMITVKSGAGSLIFDATQSAQTGISGISGSNTLFTSGTVVFSGSNMITVKSGAGSLIFDATQSAQAAQTGISGISGSNTLFTSGTVVFSGSNMITVKSGAGSLIFDATQSAQAAQTGISGLSVPSTAYTSGTVVLTGSNNISVTSSGAGQTIIVSGPNLHTLSAGNSTFSSGNILFTGSGNITVTASAAGQTVIISGTQSIGPSAFLLSAVNTSGTLSTITSGSIMMVGGNNITLSQNNQTITISAFNATQSTGPSAFLLSAVNTSGTLSTITSGSIMLAAGNNITLSQNNQSITISAFNATQSTCPAAIVIGSNTSGTTASIVSGTVNLYGGANITLSQNANSITISAAAGAGGTSLAQLAIGGNTSGTLSTITSGSIVFAGGNNITLSQNNQSITISAAALGGTAPIGTQVYAVASVASTGTVNRYAPEDHVHAGIGVHGVSGGNTSNTSGMFAGSVALAGGNNITLSMVTGAGGQSVTISAFNQTQSTCPAQFQFGGNTSGTLSTCTSGTIQLNGGNNITLSQNGQAVTISGKPLVMFMYPQCPCVVTTGMPNIAIGAPGATNTTVSAYVFPMPFDYDLSFNYVGLHASLSATSANTNSTYAYTGGVGLGIYSLNGANLSLLSSFANQFNFSYNSATASTQASASLSVSFGQAGVSSAYNTSSNNMGASSNWVGTTGGSINLPLYSTASANMSSISAGQYWGVFYISYSSLNIAWFSISQIIGSLIPGGNPGIGFGGVYASNYQMFDVPFRGYCSAVLSTSTNGPFGVLPNSIATANVTTYATSMSLINAAGPVVFMCART